MPPPPSAPTPSPRWSRILLWIPLVGFLILIWLVTARLIEPGSERLETRLVGQPLPSFALPAIVPDRPGLTSKDRQGEVRLLNLFASWCGPCVAEAPVLAGLARDGVVIQGVALRDRPADLRAFLERNGNPYVAIGADPGSRLSFDLGASGVPESFIIDRAGVIRYHFVGPILPQNRDEILRQIRLAGEKP